MELGGPALLLFVEGLGSFHQFFRLYVLPMSGDEPAIAGRVLNAAAAIPVEHIHGLNDVATAGLKRLMVNAVDVRDALVSWRSRAGVQRDDSAEPRASQQHDSHHVDKLSKNNPLPYRRQKRTPFHNESTQGFFETDRNVGWLSVLKVIKVLGHCTWATPNTGQPKPAHYG